LTTKEYLNQAYYLDKLINAKMEQQQQLRDLIMRITPTLSHDKSSGGSIENKKESYICKYADLEKEIESDIDRLINTKQEIESTINKIKNPKYRLLLTLKYINNKSYEDIAAEMDFKDVRWVHQLHKRALKVIEILK